MCFLLPLDEENVRKIMRRANQLEHAWKMSLLSPLERKKHMTMIQLLSAVINSVTLTRAE
jgi:hypothetical protein